MPNTRATDLLCVIVRCPEVAKTRTNSNHPCATIVESQGRFDIPFQPPNPWIGHLADAKILFVGSNPSIGGAEFYPEADWPDEDLIDFFDNAFDGRLEHIRDGVRARRSDGTYGNWVRTWAGIRRRAAELLDGPLTPGVDYAMTEIVRCRSQNEVGVSEARTHCADLYLDETISCSQARLIVGLGAHVRDWLRRRWELGTDPVARIKINGVDRLIAFLPHPTSRGLKTFSTVMPNELPRLRAALTDDSLT